MPNSITIGQVAARLRMLDVKCGRCPRAGRLSMTRLLREHGPDAPLWHATQLLNADCPNRDGQVYTRCDLHCPQLSALFMSEPAPGTRR